MADIVISEFLDEALVRQLATTHDVRYEPALVERRDDLRTAHKAMAKICSSILAHGRSHEADALCVALPKPFAHTGVGA